MYPSTELHITSIRHGYHSAPTTFDPRNVLQVLGEIILSDGPPHVKRKKVTFQPG